MQRDHYCGSPRLHLSTSNVEHFYLLFLIFIHICFRLLNKLGFASYADDNTICYRKWCKRGH